PHQPRRRRGGGSRPVLASGGRLGGGKRVLTMTLTLDARNARNDNENCRAMLAAPPGSRIIIDLGHRTDCGDGRLAHWLSESIETHHIDLHGSPSSLRSWSGFLRILRGPIERGIA